MKSGDLWIAGTHICGQVIEWDEVLAYRAALVGIIHTGVRVPDLAVWRGAHPVGIEAPALITAQFAEISSAFLSARHSGVLRHRLAGAAALIVEKEEGAVLLDGPAYRAAEVVPAYGSNFDAGLIVEEVVGIQLVVAQEIVEAAMEVVGSRAGDDVYHGGPAKADFRAEVGLLDLKLLHGVDRGCVEGVHDGRVLLHPNGAYPVDQDVSLRITAAV